MNISSIRDFLKSKHGPVSIIQIAKYCACTPQELAPILELWQAKGKIVNFQPCSTCPFACQRFTWQD